MTDPALITAPAVERTVEDHRIDWCANGFDRSATMLIRRRLSLAVRIVPYADVARLIAFQWSDVGVMKRLPFTREEAGKLAGLLLASAAAFDRGLALDADGTCTILSSPGDTFWIAVATVTREATDPALVLHLSVEASADKKRDIHVLVLWPDEARGIGEMLARASAGLPAAASGEAA